MNGDGACFWPDRESSRLPALEQEGDPRVLEHWDRGRALNLWLRHSQAERYDSSVPKDFPASTNVVVTDRGSERASSVYDEDGVDRSLIRWMLRLSPADRLAHAQGVIDMVKTVRRPADGDR